MLRNSLGSGITNVEGLSTVECLTALCAGFRAAPGDWHIGFAFGYDVNMILRDLRVPALRRVHQGKWVTFDGFRFRYRRAKQFTVQQFDRRTGRWAGGTVWDVFGFYQASFVRACEMNGVGDPHIREAVLAMKQARSTFKADDLAAIEAYCEKECELLVLLLEQLKRDMNEASLKVTRWDGAGAVASALLAREGVKQYKSVEVPTLVADAVQRAFAGGRIELLQYGHFQGELHHYDINSAYPTALGGAPCLSHGRWRHRSDARAVDARGAAGSFGIYRVRWRGDAGAAIHPFFWRAPDGRVFFPASGEGWYWGPELQAHLSMPAMQASGVGRGADRAVPSRRGLAGDLRKMRACRSQKSPGTGRLGLGHEHLTILESWVWEPACDHRPFGFIPTLFTQRQQWKREGRGAEKVLKLGLNSLYGKCAQHIGGEPGQPPSWHQLEWAGYTTSVTRATLYRAAMQDPSAIIFIATDGIYSTRPLDLPLGKGLGEWSYERHRGLTAVQSGVYWVDNEDGTTSCYHRGFDAQSLDREAVLRAWSRGHQTVTAQSTRFIGMGQALAGGSMWAKWRQWVSSPRVLQLTPEGTKRTALASTTRPHLGLVPTAAYDPAIEGLQGLSTPAYLPWRAVSEYPTESDGDDAEDAWL